jgi:hypothetical protein
MYVSNVDGEATSELSQTQYELNIVFQCPVSLADNLMYNFERSFTEYCLNHHLSMLGRAITQVVSRRLPTAEVRARAQIKSCGICGGQSGSGAGFLRVLRFPLPVFIPPTAPYSSSSSSTIWGWYDRPISGRRITWTQPHPTPRN